MKKKYIRITIDTAMTVLLPMLMAYSLIGEKFHEIAGSVMFVLLIAHHIMNRGWFKTLLKGKYSAARIFRTVLNMLLLVFMILQPVSGILMSKYLYTFIQIPGVSATAREIHLFLAYWGFILMCVHAGTHLTAPLGKLQSSRKAAWITTVSVLAAVSLYGCLAFVKRRLADYMFLKSSFVFFDFSEPRILFFLDYTAVMILFAVIGLLITMVLTKLSERGK